MARVMIHPADYETVREAVDKAFELFPLELSGRKVLIKPNVLRYSEYAEGIVTHPAVLRAVVEKVEGMGPASLIVGDNPGLYSYGDNEASFRKTGLTDASKGYYQNIGNDSILVDFNADFMASVGLSRAVAEADVIISLPKFKTHGLTIITGAIKNSYGYLPGAQKARLHRAAGNPYRFHELVVDVFKLRPPDLFIMDAVVGMEGNGPACTDLRDIGLILASDNAVAMDSVVATMMGLEPGVLRFLQKAKELGLGDYDPDSIEIVGELRKLPDWKLPALSGDTLESNPAVAEMMTQRTLIRPHADPDLCTSCGTCVDHCPVSALSLVGGIPEVDKELCITCFCCQEMCPEKAIALS